MQTHKSNLIRTGACMVAACTLSSCQLVVDRGMTSPRTAELTVRSSAEGASVPPGGLAAPEFQLVPTRQYGSSNGSLVLSSMGEFAVAGGLLFVAQPRVGEVAIVRIADGKLIRVARRGEGPGEFKSPGTAGVFGDTVWIADPGLGRITLFDFQGGLLTTFRFPAHHSVVGLTTDGAVLAHRFGGIETTPQPLLRYRRSEERGETLLLMRRPFPQQVDARLASGGNARFQNPFAQVPIAQLDSDGKGAVVVSMDGPRGREIEIVRALGDQQSVVHVNYPARNVEDDFERMFRGPSELHTKEGFRKLPFPEFWVPVNRVLVARNGDIWLGSNIRGQPVNWTIVNRTGQIVGRLASPANGWLQLVDGNDVWGFELSTDDVPVIVRYQLKRA